MALEINPTLTGTTARLELVGELDGKIAPAVREAVDKLLSGSPQILILDVADLTFMSSAGLRVLIFAKQKQPNLKIYVVKPQAPVIDTLRKTGFYDAVYVTETEPDLGTAAS
jgi:anti-anti-sigma factor